MRTIPFGKPIVGEEECRAVCKVLKSGVLAHGKKIEEFEDAFAQAVGAPYAVGVSSCTAALHMSYVLHGIGPGDEVIVPAQTHVATAHAVELVGAKPVFVDAEGSTGNVKLSRIEEKISKRTKALSVVHFLGMPVDMIELKKLTDRHDLFVIEDCALALGSYYDGIHAGLFGDVGCFSFYPVKHITSAEGGMLITRDEDIAKGIKRLRAFGMDRHVGERLKPGIYNVVGLGYNYRMNELQAALGVEQLKRLPSFLKKRRDNYEYMTNQLSEIEGIELLSSTGGKYKSSYYCHAVVLSGFLRSKRDNIALRLKQLGVGTSVYYPKPVPLMTYYKDKYGYSEQEFPVSTRLSESSIALPVGPHIDRKDIDYIADSIRVTIREEMNNG